MQVNILNNCGIDPTQRLNALTLAQQEKLLRHPRVAQHTAELTHQRRNGPAT
jgi:hypothetical protein